VIGWLAAASGTTPATARGPQDPPPAALTSLTGTEWTIVELAGAPVTSKPGPREPHLSFLANGKVAGADGCNRVTGSYKATPPNGVTFGPAASTRMACPGVEDVGARLASALQGTSHWSLVEGRLQLLGATGKPLAILARRAATPAGAPSAAPKLPAKVRGAPASAKPVKP
jgi:heat shock protein HslJ